MAIKIGERKAILSPATVLVGYEERETEEREKRVKESWERERGFGEKWRRSNEEGRKKKPILELLVLIKTTSFWVSEEFCFSRRGRQVVWELCKRHVVCRLSAARARTDALPCGRHVIQTTRRFSYPPNDTSFKPRERQCVQSPNDASPALLLQTIGRSTLFLSDFYFHFKIIFHLIKYIQFIFKLH